MDLHTKFESGAMFTAGPSGAAVGVSGINEITNRINVESGLLGTDITNLTAVSGAYVTTSGAGYSNTTNLTAVSGAYVATSGALVTDIANLTVVSGAYNVTSGTLITVSGAGYTNKTNLTTVSGAGYVVSGAYVATSGAFYNYSKSKTSYWSCVGGDFVGNIGTADNAYIDRGNTYVSSGILYIAPISLPHGAVVTSAKVEGNGGRIWSLYSKQPNTDGPYSCMATGSMNQVDTTITAATIDNENYAYYFYVSGTSWGGALTGARITYTTLYD